MAEEEINTLTDDGRNIETAEYVANVKEKAILKGNHGVGKAGKTTFVKLLAGKAGKQGEISEKDKELTKCQAQNYDLSKKIETLEKENAKLKKELESQDKRRRKKKPMKRKVARRKKTTTNDEISKPQVENDVFETTETLYAAIASKYPQMSLSTVLLAEQKFIEADTNNDGTMDAVELEKLLDSANIPCTKAEVLEILQLIDEDGTKTLDFLECIEACDILERKKNSKLSQSLQTSNKSNVCLIQ